MNLRILKKLSKRAAPLLCQLPGWHTRPEFFPADCDSGTSSGGHDRKHWDRNPAVHDDAFPGSIVLRPRRPHPRRPFVHLRQPLQPWVGTPMVGWSSGYETPEWEEHTAWEELTQITHSDVTDYHCSESDDGGPEYTIIQRLRLANPTAILRHARALAVVRA